MQGIRPLAAMLLLSLGALTGCTLTISSDAINEVAAQKAAAHARYFDFDGCRYVLSYITSHQNVVMAAVPEARQPDTCKRPP